MPRNWYAACTWGGAMLKLERILFPVDFTPHCRTLAPMVAAWARRFHSRVTLLHASDLPAGAYADWYSFLNLMDVNAYHEHARKQLRAFLPAVFKGVEVDRVLVDAAAGPAIVEHARKMRPSLIMMPTRGMSRFRSLLLGSVTTYVLHDSEYPVWTEAHLEAPSEVLSESREVLPADCRSIVCGVDFGSATEPALRMATGLAQAFGAPVHVVHVTGDSEMSRNEAGERFQETAEKVNLASKLELLSGDVPMALATAVQAHGADLLVIGRGKVQGTIGRLRNQAHSIIRTSPCPVVSV
ncbi:MAG: universal stress protein [Bryobacteraceae bacterium]